MTNPIPSGDLQRLRDAIFAAAETGSKGKKFKFTRSGVTVQNDLSLGENGQDVEIVCDNAALCEVMKEVIHNLGFEYQIKANAKKPTLEIR